MNDDEFIFRKIYQVAYSHHPKTRGWCVYENVGNTLFYVDGPWLTESEAKKEMSILYKDQGTNVNGVKD